MRVTRLLKSYIFFYVSTHVSTLPPTHTHIACLTGCRASVVIVSGKLNQTNFK